MLKRFKMEDSKPVSTLMITSCKLSKDDESLEVDHTMYRSMIGIRLYVTATRPDVMQAVGLVSRFHSSPKETHVTIIKRIFKYLKGTMEYGLWYPKSQYFNLKTFADVDWVRSVVDRKRTSGKTFFLGNCLVSWLSKKQSSISLSTAEAKYTAAASCCTQAIRMEQSLEDLLVKYENPIVINCDNTSAIVIPRF